MNVVQTSPDASVDDGQRSGGEPQRRLGGGTQFLERFGLAFLLVVLIIVFSALSPDTFATVQNWRTIAVSQSVLAVVAIALVFPLVGGRFDISVGANAGLASIVTAAMMSRYDQPLVVAVAAGLVTGLVIGQINGALVAYLGINSIIATLGVSTVLGGIVQAYTSGIPISSNLSPALTDLSIREFARIPVLFLIMIVIACMAAFILTQTPYGRYLLGIGSNESAAALVGLPIRRYVLLSFVIAGGFAGAAGVLQVAAQGNGNPQVGGIGFMLPALAAVFLGATTLQPGRYNIPGTLLGLFFVGTAVSGLALQGAQPWITDIFNGGAVVVAVGLSAYFRRQRTGAVALGQ